MNWTTIKYKLLIALLTPIAYIPTRILYVISDLFYPLVYYVLRYRKKTVRRNLEKVFAQKPVKEIRRIEKRYYHHFCDCFVETIKLLHISDKELNRRVNVTNGDLIDKIAADNRPIVLFLGHYGNWEWAQAISLHYKRPGYSGQIYRPLHNAVMEKVMLKIRSRFNTTCIPQKKAFRVLLGLIKEGQQFIIGFISDQRPNTPTLPYWTMFLGQETAFSIGGEHIGKKINANFVYLDVEKERRGHYKMTFKEMDISDINNTEYPYSIKFMRMLETTICRAPEYWLWSHKRWRIAREENNPIIN